MRRILLLAALLIAFWGGGVARAQLASWGWWGTSVTTIVPISASNPLPVHCQ